MRKQLWHKTIVRVSVWNNIYIRTITLKWSLHLLVAAHVCDPDGLDMDLSCLSSGLERLVKSASSDYGAQMILSLRKGCLHDMFQGIVFFLHAMEQVNALAWELVYGSIINLEKPGWVELILQLLNRLVQVDHLCDPWGKWSAPTQCTSHMGLRLYRTNPEILG